MDPLFDFRGQGAPVTGGPMGLGHQTIALARQRSTERGIRFPTLAGVAKAVI